MKKIADKNSIKKILVIKLRGIGDVILSTIIFNSLLENLPEAKIDFLTEQPSKPLLENINIINEVLIFERNSFKNRVKLAFSVRNRKYDLVIDLFSNPSSAQITYFSGAKYRVGFPYRGRKYAYNIFGPSNRQNLHSADLNLELISSFIDHSSSNELYIGLDQNHKTLVSNYLTDHNLSNKMLVGLIPSGGWPSKRCNPLKMAEIADAIIKKYNAFVIILWGPGDENDAQIIYNSCDNETYLAPSTSILQMASFIKICDICIANDSGPMHISTAVGTPTLSLHGPTSPFTQGPYGRDKHEWVRLDELDCIQCNLLECPKKHECFNELPVERVLSKLESLIRKNNINLL